MIHLQKKTSYKNKILLYFFLLVGFPALSQIDFVDDFKDVFKKAQLESKFVFIEYYNPDCPVCMGLEPLLKDEKLGDYYNKYFISYQMNTENMTEEEEQFLEESGLRFKSVPYFLFFNKDKEFVHHSGTRRDIDYLLQIGRTALQPQLRTSNLENKYETGDRSVKTLYAYCQLLHLYEKDSMIKVVADDLHKSLPKKDARTKKGYIVTQRCVNHIDNGFFKYWINHLDEMKQYNKEGYEEMHLNIMQNIINQSIYSNESKSWDLDKIQEVKEMIIKSGMSDNPDVFFWERELRLHVKNGDLSEAYEILENRIPENNDAAALYAIEVGFKNLPVSDELKQLYGTFKNIQSELVEPKRMSTAFILEIYYLKKIGETDQLIQNKIEEAKAYYSEQGIPFENFMDDVDSVE